MYTPYFRTLGYIQYRRLILKNKSVIRGSTKGRRRGGGEGETCCVAFWITEVFDIPYVFNTEGRACGAINGRITLKSSEQVKSSLNYRDLQLSNFASIARKLDIVLIRQP